MDRDILLRVISETRRFLEDLEEDDLSINSEETRVRLYELFKLIHTKCESLDENGMASDKDYVERQKSIFEEYSDSEMEAYKTRSSDDCHRERFQTQMSVSGNTEDSSTYSTFDMCTNTKPVTLFRTELNFVMNCVDVGPIEGIEHEVSTVEVTSDNEVKISSEEIQHQQQVVTENLEETGLHDVNDNVQVFPSTDKSSEKRFEKLSKSLIKKIQRKFKMNMLGPLDASMVDLIRPDLSGWLLDDSDKKLKWCVIADMLFCLFENEKSNSASEVFVLPACTVRELHFRSSAQGTMRKFQIVVTSTSSSEKKAVLSADTVDDHCKWLTTLQNAIGQATDIFHDSTDSDIDSDSANGSMGSGYYPSPVKGQPTSSGYDPTAPGSVTRDERLQKPADLQMRELFLKTHSVSVESAISSSENEVDGLCRVRSTSDESEEDEVPSLPESKPNHSPQPRRRISYLLATEHQMPKSNSKNKPRGLMEKLQQRSPRGPHIRLSRSMSPNVVKSGSKVKDPRKVRVKLESLKERNLATYLRYKENGKVSKMWCVICGSILYSFKSKNQNERCDLGLDLDFSEVSVTNATELEFQVRFQGTDYMFCAQDRYDFKRWIGKLLPGSDVNVPNVALKSALRRSSGSFCLDDEIMRSLEELVDLRLNQETRVNIDSQPDGSVNTSTNSESNHGTGGSAPNKREKTFKPWRRKSSKEMTDDILNDDSKRLSSVSDVIPNYHEPVSRAHEPEMLAYSAASEGSSDDDDIIVGLNSSPDTKNTSRDSGHISDSSSSKRNNGGSISSSRWMQRKYGFVGIPLMKNNQMSLDRRHGTLNGTTPKLMTSSAESVITRRRLQKMRVGQDHSLIRTGSLDTDLSTGILRSASSDRLPVRRSSHHRIQGEVDIRDEGGAWRRVWATYDGHTLCFYPDRTSAQPDRILDIPRCTLEMKHPGGGDGKDYVQVKPLGKGVILLSAQEATRRWHDIMHDNVTKLAYEGLNLEDAYSREFQLDSKQLQEEEKKRRFKEELAQLKKEQLLSELLQQKRELEQKQAERNQAKTQSNTESPSRQENLLAEADESQLVRDITFLQQRKMSTQIKVDRISKQLLESSKKQEKRFPFRFVLSKKETNENSKRNRDQLESHLKELTDKLETIEENLTRTQETKEKAQKRTEEKKLHESYSAGDFQRLSAFREADLDPLSLSYSGVISNRFRAATDPVEGVVRRAYAPCRVSKAKKRLSEPPRLKPKIEIDPGALAEIEEFEQMTKMFLAKEEGNGFHL